MFCEFLLNKNEKDDGTESVLSLVHSECSINAWRNVLSPAQVSPPQSVGICAGFVPAIVTSHQPKSSPRIISHLTTSFTVPSQETAACPGLRLTQKEEKLVYKVKPDEIKSDVRKDLPRWWKPAWGELAREGGLASWGRGTWVKSVTTSPASGIWMGIWNPSALGHRVP